MMSYLVAMADPYPGLSMAWPLHNAATTAEEVRSHNYQVQGINASYPRTNTLERVGYRLKAGQPDSKERGRLSPRRLDVRGSAFRFKMQMLRCCFQPQEKEIDEANTQANPSSNRVI
jgi:hypothetical protein